MRNFQKLAVKYRLEQDRVDPSVQRQTQATGENHVKEQLMPEQRKNINTSQVEQNTSTSIEQGRYITPKHLNRPQAGKIQTPNYPDPVMKPPPRPPDKITQNDRQINLDLDPEINQEFEENSPYQEGIISEIYQRPEKSQIEEPPELADLVNTDKIVQRHLPKQTNVDKILKVIQRKGNSPVTIKEIQAGYLNSPYFKDLYLYLRINYQVQRVLYTKQKY